jgi:5'-3' exonuclease
MGIKLLNKFLSKTCSDEIPATTLAIAKGKTVAVDISIYLYEFARKNIPLVDGFRQMARLFQLYQIQPIFVFDGPPPATKRPVIQKRIEQKKKAATTHKKLKTELEAGRIESTPELLQKIDTLRAQAASVSMKQIRQVRKWLEEEGHVHVTAEGEADPMCAQLVRSRRAWACFSNDTDLFLYGCPRIISNVCWWDEPDNSGSEESEESKESKEKNESEELTPIKRRNKRNMGDCSIAYLDKIRYRLQMDTFSFIQMLVLAGTEYHAHIAALSIYKIYKLWPKYIDYLHKNTSKIGPAVPFAIWLQKYTQINDEHNGELYRAHLHTAQHIMLSQTQTQTISAAAAAITVA